MSQPTIAVVGASADRKKFGNKAVRAYARKGYKVFPINPKEESIEGHKVFRSILDVEEDLDMISVYLPPKLVMKMLDDFVAKGAREIWLNPGAESDEVMEAARQKGIEPIAACSIVGAGMSPRDFED